MKKLADYTYNVSLKTLLGQKNGTIEVFNKDGNLTGYLNILGKHNAFEGSIDNKGHCVIKGNLVTLVQSIPYTAEGHADEKTIDLTLKCKRYSFHLCGNS